MLVDELRRQTGTLSEPRNLPRACREDDYFMRLFRESKTLDIDAERFQAIIAEMRRRWAELTTV